MKDYHQRFRERFTIPYTEIAEGNATEILAFIEKEIEAAKQEERNRIIKMIDGKKLVCLKTHTFEEWKSSLPYCKDVRKINSLPDDILAHLQADKETL